MPGMLSDPLRLHDAALKGQMEVTRVLLEHGANVRTRNSDGATPLHDAALGGQVGIVALLLDKGAEINVQENSGATPFYQAAAWGRLETVDLLVRKGADTSIRTREGIKSVASGDRQPAPDGCRAAAGLTGRLRCPELAAILGLCFSAGL
jgi:ankyrin repeat protein